jgi:hypothetical protein
LPIIQEIDNFLESDKFRETFETVIDNPGYQAVARELPLAMEAHELDAIRAMLHPFFLS